MGLFTFMAVLGGCVIGIMLVLYILCLLLAFDVDFALFGFTLSVCFECVWCLLLF